MRYRGLLHQLASFSLVGICSNLLGYCVYLVLVGGGIAPKLAITLLYFTGAFVSFIGNKRLTFRDTGGILSSGSRYIAVYFLGYIVNLSLIVAFVDIMGLPHQVVQFLAIFFVALFLFILLRRFVFVHRPSTQ